MIDNALIRWLLDIDRLPPDAAGLHLVFERPFPGWVWTLILFAVVLFAIWSYSRMLGSRTGRGILAGVRSFAILLLFILISGPALELERFNEEPDWVLFLVDRSASMSIADAGSDVTRQSRDEQLRELLAANRETLETIDTKHHSLWLGFHNGVFELSALDEDDDTEAMPEEEDEPIVELGDADGRRTQISTAIEQALQRAAARPISGVVLLSDGRTAEPPQRALLRRLQADAIPVVTVPLGSDKALGDLAVRRVDAPQRAFVRDKVPVAVELERFGESADALEGVIRLVDQDSGEVLDSIELEPGESASQLVLTAEPKVAGQASWRIEIETDRPDLIPDNNMKPIAIELVDRPLRVLYIDGYPRWEYRFVKWLLIREESIESSIMLISADRDFAQEGNVPITRLPRTAEEFQQFDLIILGDVPSSFFSPTQLELMRSHISEHGAGLLWIGGERSTPLTYAGSVLADLLPIRGTLALQPVGQPVNMAPTPLAERLGVLQMVAESRVGWPPELSDPSVGWSRLHWVQRIDPPQVKPTAEALATTVSTFDEGALPLVLHMRYGAGQIIYVATDEIWRWRYGRGELLPEQFWIQMVRLLGRVSLAGGDQPAILNVEPRRVAVAQPMQIELQLRDARLVELGLDSIAAQIETPEGDVIAELDLQPNGDRSDRFAAAWLPDQIGLFRIRVVEPELAGLSLEVDVEVDAPDNELRRPETDHELLETLAADTGGVMLPPEEFDRINDLNVLKNRSIRTYNPLTERIWDTPLAFLLLLLALTGEWIGRKVLRLA